MAYNHIYSNQNNDYKYARLIGDTVVHGIEFLKGLRLMRDEMVQMKDGSDYTRIETLFKIESGKGQAALDETDALLGKIDSDASTSNVKAALAQWIAKLG